jgi:hypothetical protein
VAGGAGDHIQLKLGVLEPTINAHQITLKLRLAGQTTPPTQHNYAIIVSSLLVCQSTPESPNSATLNQR